MSERITRREATLTRLKAHGAVFDASYRPSGDWVHVGAAEGAIEDAERAAREEEAEEIAKEAERRADEAGWHPSPIAAWIRARHAKKPEPAVVHRYEVTNQTKSPVTVTFADEARMRELVREGIEADHVLHDLGRDVRVRKMVGEELKTKIREWIKTERIT